MTEAKFTLNSTKLVTIILTFNSEHSIAKVISSCRSIASRILVVDSFSSDQTMNLVQSLGCEVVQHEFENYSKQRNWALAHANLNPQDWVLHLDSDEVVSSELSRSIQQVLSSDKDNVDGYLVQKLSYFLGKPIRFGSINPSWQLIFFRASKGFCEDRLYDQHFVVTGKTKKLKGLLLDLQLATLERWTNAHNRWSSAEALEAALLSVERDNSRMLPATLSGDPRMRKRWLKNNVWYRSPLLLRAFVYFIYSYVWRLGFLDGQVGLIYHVLQAFWFRFLVDAKIIEMQLNEREASDELLQ